jgi:hypothetical protein
MAWRLAVPASLVAPRVRQAQTDRVGRFVDRLSKAKLAVTDKVARKVKSTGWR